MSEPLQISLSEKTQIIITPKKRGEDVITIEPSILINGAKPHIPILVDKLKNDWYERPKELEALIDKIKAEYTEPKIGPNFDKDALNDLAVKIRDILPGKMIELKRAIEGKEREKRETKEPKKSTGYATSYTVEDGEIYNNIFNGEEYNKIPIANFSFEFVKEIRWLEDKDKVEYETNIMHEGKLYPFNIDNEILNEPKKFSKKLDASCSFVTYKNILDVIQAFRELKKFPIIIKKTSRVGWYKDEIDETETREMYITRSTIIDSGNITPNTSIVVEMPETAGPAKFIDITEIAEEEFRVCGIHVFYELMKLHDPYFMRVAISKTFGAPFLNEMAKNVDEARYPTDIVGKPQVGKSLVMRLMQSFFGYFPFSGEEGFATFGSTPYAVEYYGHFFKDMLFLADDIKQRQLNDKSFMQHLSSIKHNYVSNTGRGRMGSSVPSSKPIQGSLIITSEGRTTQDEGDASRTFVLYVPAFKNDATELIKDKCFSIRHLYPGFMGKYIQWRTMHGISIDLLRLIKSEFKKHFSKMIGVDISRFVNMYTITWCEYYMFLQFMKGNRFITPEEEKEEAEVFLKQLGENGKDSVISLSKADPACNLIDIIRSEIASGNVIILSGELKTLDDQKKRVVGRLVDGTIRIIPNIAIEIAQYKILKMGNSFSSDKDTLTKSFDEKKLLKAKDKAGLLKTTRFGKASEKCWAFSPSLFYFEDEKHKPIKDRMKIIPGLIALEVSKLKLPEGAKPSKLQFDNVKVEIYKGLELTENEVNDHADIIDLIVTAYWKGKGWSYDIQSWMKDNIA